MKTFKKNIRVPIGLVESKTLTGEEKMFYVKLLYAIVSNETAVIPHALSYKERSMLKRLETQKFIQGYTEQGKITTVKFDLKGFVFDEINRWAERVDKF